jgi:hypothetical protein
MWLYDYVNDGWLVAEIKPVGNCYVFLLCTNNGILLEMQANLQRCFQGKYETERGGGLWNGQMTSAKKEEWFLQSVHKHCTEGKFFFAFSYCLIFRNPLC